jgi:predicted nucleic acid-binding protein
MGKSSSRRQVVPKAVRRELVHPRGPDVVQERISSSPSWRKVEAVDSDAGSLPRGEEQQGDLQDLDPGEREAILLAVRAEAGLFLIDERAGRAASRRHGVTVTDRSVSSERPLRRVSSIRPMQYAI